jgi:hypothetical protein
MQCPNCGKEIRDTASVCGYCGQPLHLTPTKCPQCANEPREGAKVCGYCGYKFGGETQSPNPETALSSEQRDVSPAASPPVTSELAGTPQTSSPPVNPGPAPAAIRPREPKSKLKPEPTRTKAASPAPARKPQARTQSKGKFYWIWITIALVTLAGGFALVQTQGWLADDIYAGAIGNWEGRDGGDGSYQTMAVRRTLAGSYRIQYVDEGASVCNGESGRATFEGKPNGNYLSSVIQFECDLDTGQALGQISFGLTYNALNDTLIDSWGDTWKRK